MVKVAPESQAPLVVVMDTVQVPSYWLLACAPPIAAANRAAARPAPTENLTMSRMAHLRYDFTTKTRSGDKRPLAQWRSLGMAHHQDRAPGVAHHVAGIGAEEIGPHGGAV